MKMESVIRLINIDSIIPNRFQPRLEFDQDALNELADSIREHGIIQPLVLRRIGDKFEIIAGERRYKAATMVGLNAVPAIITDLDDNESAEVAVVENVMRKNLSVIEEARSYKKLLDRNYITQSQLAKRLGTSQANIANKVRLLNLDNQVQDALLKEKISERHARSLLKLADKSKQIELLNRIISEKMTVKELDQEIDDIIGTNIRNDESMLDIETNRNDIKIEDIMNKAVDIEPSGPIHQYANNQENYRKKKDALFFNNLENESVNMGTSLNFGFNPFVSNRKEDEDFDILNIEEDKEEILSEDEEETEQNKIKEKAINTPEDILEIINNLTSKAINAEIKIEKEDFNFDDSYQIIIRIPKDKE